MKQKLIFLSLVVFFLTEIVLGQETRVKMRFGAFGENETFFTDLKAADLQIRQAKDLSLKLITNNSLEILIMVDASASQERMLPVEKKVAETFINDFLKSGKDKVAIVSFSGGVILEQDLTDNFQKAREQVNKIEFVPPSGYVGGGIIIGKTPPNKNQVKAGSTSIWDSLKQVLEAFSKIPSNNSQRAVLLISDGVNTFGEAKIREAVESSIKTNIPVYAVGIGDENYNGVDKKSLKKVTEESGGISAVPKKKLEDLSKHFRVFEQSLRFGYEVTFLTNPINLKNKLQEFKIEITNPELRKGKLQIIQPKWIFIN